MEKEKETRSSTGFLMKQRAFLKLYLITYIEQGRPYGLQMLEDLKQEFRHLGYKPNHAEIYRSLHDLLEAGILKRGKKTLEGSKYQEIAVYYIRDAEKAKAYKTLVKHDIDRNITMLRKALKDNFV